MKWLLLFTLITLSVSTFGQQRKASFRLVKVYLTDVNNDNIVDTIVISSSLKDKRAFNRVSVTIAGFNKKTFVAKDSWTFIDSPFLKKNKNEINSRFVFLKKTPKHTAILLFGTLDGAGYREEFSILNIENNNCRMVFDHVDNEIDVEIPQTLTDLEHNGRLQFIFSGFGEYYKQLNNRNADIGTYHPFFVFTVDSICGLNKPLMKVYNQQHYVFAGYKYSEDIQILYPRNGGRPKIWKK